MIVIVEYNIFSEAQKRSCTAKTAQRHTIYTIHTTLPHEVGLLAWKLAYVVLCLETT